MISSISFYELLYVISRFHFFDTFKDLNRHQQFAYSKFSHIVVLYYDSWACSWALGELSWISNGHPSNTETSNEPDTSNTVARTAHYKSEQETHLVVVLSRSKRMLDKRYLLTHEPIKCNHCYRHFLSNVFWVLTIGLADVILCRLLWW